MIKTIIFDIGNVLTDFRWREFYKDKGYDDELLERLGKATVQSPDWCEYDRGVLTDEEVLKRFISNDPKIENEIRAALADTNGIVTGRDYAIPWVKELKDKGYQVLYLSNFSAKIRRECADALEFIPYTDGGIFSYEDYVIKPGVEIYLLLLHRFGLKPEECVFLDDTAHNLEVAAELGINTILYTDRESAVLELKKLGVE